MSSAKRRYTVNWFGIERNKADIAKAYHVTPAYFTALCQRKQYDCIKIYEALSSYTDRLYSIRMRMTGKVSAENLYDLSDVVRTCNLARIPEPTEWERAHN